MRVLLCLVSSLAVGCGAYAAGAIVWAVLDPQGAGMALLFTIPFAIAGAAAPGAAAAILVVNRCDWDRAIIEPTPAPAAQHQPQIPDYDDLEWPVAA